MTSSLHILIMGAGLSGPALAIALAHAGIRSTIFEIRPDAAYAGGSILLTANALRVLDKVVGVYEPIKARGYAFDIHYMYSEDGVKLGEMQLGNSKDGGYPAVRIQRGLLHAKLLEKCRETGMAEIRYGMALSRVQEDDEGVKAIFEDGSEVSGDILIGADGIHSIVRRLVLGDAAPVPTYIGQVSVGAVTPLSKIDTPADFAYPTFILTRKGMLMAIPDDPAGERVGWVAHRTVPERTREGWTTLRKSGEAAQIVKDDYADTITEPIRSMLDQHDPGSVIAWAPYEIPDLPTWHTSRICLMGDAAHAISPAGGQGAAQAFEDVGLMARLIMHRSDAAGTDYAAMFEHFEKTRKARLVLIKELTDANNRIRVGSEWTVMWWIRKWGMKAFFWWKGGMWRDDRITGYDVMEESVEF